MAMDNFGWLKNDDNKVDDSYNQSATLDVIIRFGY
jgi:hypothetical protein